MTSVSFSGLPCLSVIWNVSDGILLGVGVGVGVGAAVAVGAGEGVGVAVGAGAGETVICVVPCALK